MAGPGVIRLASMVGVLMLGLQLVSTLSQQLDAELEVTGRQGVSVQLTFAAEG